MCVKRNGFWDRVRVKIRVTVMVTVRIRVRGHSTVLTGVNGAVQLRVIELNQI